MLEVNTGRRGKRMLGQHYMNCKLVMLASQCKFISNNHKVCWKVNEWHNDIPIPSALKYDIQEPIVCTYKFY